MPARPRLLFLGAEWFEELPGGLNRYLADLAEALTNHGVDVDVVVLGPAPNAPAYVTSVGRHNGSLIGRVRAMRAAARRVTSRVDVIDAHFALYALLPITTTKLRKKPLVVHFQGPWAEESRVALGDRELSLAVKRRVERAVYRRADSIIVLSNAFRDVITRDYGVDADKVHVMPPGVDLVRFRPGARDAARRAIGADDDAFVVVAARRLDRRMGVDTLLAAWPDVQRARPDALLLIAGTGLERDALVTAAAALPHPDRVRFLGRVSDDDLVHLYQAADCSVVPSRSLEGYGLVVLESLACGTPAIVTDAAALPETVSDLDTSLIVPADNATALARRLIAAAKGDLPSRDRCRSHAEEQSWDATARRHLELYSTLATGSATRRRMRVVFVDHTAQLSGGELALARLLPSLDVDAHVILAEDGPLVAVLERAGATVEVLPMRESTRGLHREQAATSPAAASSATAYALKLARRLRQLRPDLVHTNSLKAALYGGAAARLAGVPVLWHVRDRIEDDYLGTRSRQLVRALAKLMPAGVIANSTATLATLRLSNRIPSTAIPSPIDVAAHDRQAAADRPFTVGMVGRLAPWKGQQLFLDAFARTFHGGDERAVIVGGALFGEDDYERALHDSVHALGIADRVTFTGHVTDVGKEYAAIDVAVHASTVPEPFGQVVVEAMAAGVPVIAANAGGPAEVIADGVDGLLYPMGDVDALAAAMQRLRTDPDLRDRLIAGGRDRARAFAPDVIAAQVLNFYRRATARGPEVSASER